MHSAEESNRQLGHIPAEEWRTARRESKQRRNSVLTRIKVWIRADRNIDIEKVHNRERVRAERQNIFLSAQQETARLEIRGILWKRRSLLGVRSKQKAICPILGISTYHQHFRTR